VSRPPAEAFAQPVAARQLAALTSLFAGTAEIISDSAPQRSPHPEPSPLSNQEILDLLARRPCTLQSIAAGLNIHLPEAAKRLNALMRTGDVSALRKNGELFYRAIMTPSDQPLN
jgi:predicted Rossmann fold nucleotide-binding protein DprA/Smf involved in DNA uptake